MQQLPPALAPLGAFRQFLCYVLVPGSKPGKMDKIPVNALTGEHGVSAHDPANWVDAQTACNAATVLGPAYGVAFSFQTSDPFFFIDIDHATDGATWSPLALSILQQFPGAAVEVSQSGTGLHIFGRGGFPAGHGCRNQTYGLEFYTEMRFVALTGISAMGDANTDHTAALHWFSQTYFTGGGATSSGLDLALTTEPVPQWSGPADDTELITRALQSQSASAMFGGKKATFRDLWEHNIVVLQDAYPDPDPAKAYGYSEADAALAQHLAFWTGNHGERIQRLMLQSKLARAKWNRDDYLPRTIAVACARQTEWLTDKVPQAREMPATPAGAPRAVNVTGATFLTPAQQIDLFEGCVYITDQHRVLVPGGQLLKREQFRVVFGGYAFGMDASNERTSRDAWEAFTESQVFRAPRTDGSCFRPDLAPGEIVRDAGRTRVNTWWPIDVPRTPGDPSLFFDHLRRVLPDERDRTILLSYMAACVQHKGVKFQWAPMLQGAEGNGKTLFTRCVAEAVGRRYVHMPRADQIAAKFNAWLLGNVFIGVEDVYIPDQNREVWEILKPMITGDNLAIEGKGVDQTAKDVCCNFLLNSNHKTGVRKRQNDRRLCMMFTAQQSEADLIRDGMAGEYFPNLYDWLKGTGRYEGQPTGYSIVSELLHTYPIHPDFNPAINCQRAPHTSTTAEALAAGMGNYEQEVLEAVEQGLPGFCGGWVSSLALDRLLDAKHARLSRNARRELIEGLGYIAHPALPDGRVNNLVLPDGGRPRLYVRKDGPHLAITLAGDVAKTYSHAQESPPPFVTK